MDARFGRLLLILAALASVAAGYPTANFVVHAPSTEVAQQIAIAAEKYRKELAIEWLGHELPRWSKPCPIKVKIGAIGAGGQTTFTFHPAPNGPPEVTGWDMQIQGSLERILDSVLPHEVSHTIFACHFRRPLPRWADEGAATLVEHESERRRQILTVQQVIKTRRRIPLQTLLTIKEYPKDMQDVMTLYAEGYSLAELLVQSGGKAKYLKFLSDAHRHGWDKAIPMHYDYRDVADLERQWHEWIIAGSPELRLPEGQQLADGRRPAAAASGGSVLRSQSPDQEVSDDDPFLEAGRPERRPSDDDRHLAVDAPRPPARRAGKTEIAARNGHEDARGSTRPKGELLSLTSPAGDLLEVDENLTSGRWVDLPWAGSPGRRLKEGPDERPRTPRGAQAARDRSDAQSLPSVVGQRRSQPQRTLRGSPPANPWSGIPADDSRLAPQ